jgi:sorting nexin-1/2
MDQQKGHFTYLITGNDNQGEFEIRRRYNDFYYLRESLKKQWPGIYIPPVP